MTADMTGWPSTCSGTAETDTAACPPPAFFRVVYHHTASAGAGQLFEIAMGHEIEHRGPDDPGCDGSNYAPECLVAIKDHPLPRKSESALAHLLDEKTERLGGAFQREDLPGRFRPSMTSAVHLTALQGAQHIFSFGKSAFQRRNFALALALSRRVHARRP